MSTYILHIDKSQTKALRDIQNILSKTNGELRPIKKNTLEEEYLLKEIRNASNTTAVSYEEGIKFIRRSISKHQKKRI